MKKHLARKLFIALFILSILPISSVMLVSAGNAVVPAFAESNIISVTYQFDESEILNWLDTGQFMTNLRVMSIAGEPLTPYKVAKILLPPYTEVADVSVVGKVGGQYFVNDIPCGQPVAIIGEEPTIVGKNPNVYNSDRPYPREIYRVGSIESLYGYNILHVRLFPVQYTPSSKLALYYKEMTVHVKLNEGYAMDTLRDSVRDSEAVRKMVDNPSVLATYDSALATTEALGTTYEYVIITTPDLADEFQVLADWKAYFVDGAKVHNVSAGTSDAEIKNIINDYYTNYGTRYVLLGGDVGKIPSHKKYVNVDLGPEGYIDEDFWFANLDGDEEISYYEVYIGRAPVDNDVQAASFVNKVITYEQMPKPKANLFHQSRAHSDNFPDTRELAWQCQQYVPEDYINYELFEENDRIEKLDWIDFWRNDGIMCEHIGHGGETWYNINGMPTEVRWTNTDVASLDNTFWPVHTSVACFSGAFDYEDSLAEVYVKDADNGAIACLMNDRDGLYDSIDATRPSGDFIEMQFKGLYQEGYENIGAMLAYSKHQFIDEATNTSDAEQSGWEWCWREINLIGDPETPILTTRLQTENVVGNSGWETGDNSFWNVSTTQEPKSYIYYTVHQIGAYTGTYGFYVFMETDSKQAQYTTQSLMESQSLSKALLDTNTILKYKIYPAYELNGGVSEIPQARWEIILSFSTGNRLHYYSSLNMEPTDNSTDKHVLMPINLTMWNSFFDHSVLETYAGKFGTPPIGTTITKIAAHVISKTYAKGNKFNRVITKFDSDEDTGGLQCTPWCAKNVNTGRNYTTIQEAINAPETEDGHTISVHGKFYEHVNVNKSLTLRGQDPWVSIIDGNGTGNVVTVRSNNVSISQFTIRNGQTGIYLEYSNYTSVSSNKVSNNSAIGIYLYRCINSSVSGNTASNNIDPYGGSGIVIQNDISNSNLSLNLGDNSVTGNVVSGSEYGIWLLLSNDNLVSGNTVSNNSDYGIYVYRSRYNNITENSVTNNNYHGIYLYSSPYNNITENSVTNNNVYGIKLSASLDNNIYHNNFINNTNQATGSGLTNVWDNAYPSGGNYWSEYTNVDQFRGPDQNVTGSDWIWDSPYTIDANNVDRYPLVNPWTPTRIWTVDDDGPADFTSIQEAINAANSGDIIYVYSGIYYEHVIIEKYNSTLIGENRDTTIIDGSGTGYVVFVQAYNVSVSQFTIQNGDNGIRAHYSAYISISDNTVTNNNEGIRLHYSPWGTISANTVSNNTEGGIHIYGPKHVKITENELSNNLNGLHLTYSTIKEYPNAIYHNNFINNTNSPQAYIDGKGVARNSWHDGYPSGGNYWSDFKERYPSVEDLYSGPYQNETGSDGIWDQPYEINWNNHDDYSFVNPWVPKVHDVAVTNVTPTRTEVFTGDSLSINVAVTNEGGFTETFDVTVYYNDTAIETQTVTDLASSAETTLNFIWNTTGVEEGNCTIKAVADTVPDETDTDDNTMIDGTVTIHAWDLLDESWNQLDGWTKEGKGQSGIETLDGKSCLRNKPNRATYVTQRKDIGSLPETGYTVETSLYLDSWGSGGSEAFVAFKFYDGMHVVTIEIHSDRVVGPQNQFSLETQIQRWYTWRFVIDSDADTIYAYRDGQYVGTLTGLTDSTANDGLVYCSWTQNPKGSSGCESYTDYIKIATGLYTPS